MHSYIQIQPQCVLHTKIHSHIQLHTYTGNYTRAHTYAHPNTHINKHKPYTHTCTHPNSHTLDTYIYTQHTHSCQLHINTQHIYTHIFTAIQAGTDKKSYANTMNIQMQTHSLKNLHKHTHTYTQALNKHTNTHACKFIHLHKPIHTNSQLTCHIHTRTLIHQCISMAVGGVPGWLCIPDNLDFATCPCTVVLKTGEKVHECNPPVPGAGGSLSMTVISQD